MLDLCRTPHARYHIMHLHDGGYCYTLCMVAVEIILFAHCNCLHGGEGAPHKGHAPPSNGEGY